MKFSSKYIIIAAIALAISGCQQKAKVTPENIITYLAENPYHEQSEAEQVKSLRAFSTALNNDLITRPQNGPAGISAEFKADPARDMIIGYGVYKKPVTKKQLVRAKKIYAKSKLAEEMCNETDSQNLIVMGIGIETIVETQTGELIFKSTCPGKSTEMFAIEKSLYDNPYKTRSKAEQATVLQSYVNELNKYEVAINTSPEAKPEYTYKADISRDMIIAYHNTQEVFTPKKLKNLNKQFASEKKLRDFCKGKNALVFTSYDIGFQVILQDAAGKVYYESEICRGKTAEMSRLETSLIETPYDQRTEADQAAILKALATELSQGQQALEAINTDVHKMSYEANIAQDMIIEYAVLNKTLSAKEIKSIKSKNNKTKIMNNYCQYKDTKNLTARGIKLQLVMQSSSGDVYYKSEVCTPTPSKPKLRGSKA